MAKNKKKRVATTQKAPTAPKKSPRNIWIVAVLAVAAVAVFVALANGGSGDPASPASSKAEQDYAGRLLPAGYEAPKVADMIVYTKAIPMTDVGATQDASGFSIPLDPVVANKIVRFDYQRPDGKTLPMIAYARPSGRLFVGVSYCPPCQGVGQRIEADGTLTCESCGTRRNLENNVGLSGACKLYPLDEVPSTVAGDRIVVDSSVLDSWTAQPLDRPVG
ncbi:MAG: DUF2318 domain-containing protein [Coriobacteriia bacterium]|nr:DUF2318 domain-containing protein [Coriobacteriia bacterium]